MNTNIFLVVAMAAIIALFSPASSHAAGDKNTVIGTVTDALGRPLVDTTVKLQNAEGRDIAHTASDPQGRFSFTGIVPGTYAVVSEKKDFQTGTAIVTVGAAAAASTTIVMTSTKPLDLALAAKQLDVARNAIEPRIGASTYNISQQAIASEPQGANRPLNQVILQAPGVAQDSFGQLHVRGDHANLQYRIDGVIIPEGISGFGQALSPRFADKVELITGALPAQYGLRTAGIIDIQTKSGAYDKGGSIGLYGGSRDTIQPSMEYGGSSGRFNYFFTGDYLQNGLGIESPTAAADPIHDDSQQGHGFGYLEALLDPTSRVSFIAGYERGQFQIPNIPGQTPSLGLDVNGATAFDSALLNENQREATQYAIASYLKSAGRTDFQVSAYERYSSLTFQPDPLGDLLFNGVAQNAFKRSVAEGLQADGSYKLNSNHTLRAGLNIQRERGTSETSSSVIPTDNTGNPTSTTPITVMDNSGKTSWTYSLYLQDEWRMTPKLTLNFGGRFDRVDAFTHEDQISPRINAVYQATDTTTLHAGYARYFTPPPFELVGSETVSKFINTTNQPQVLTDDSVLAERADYFDVGVAQRLGANLNVGVDGFYKESKNLIDEGQFGAPIVLTPFNYKEGRQYGLELTTALKVDNFSAYGNIAALSAEGRDIVSSQFSFDPGDLAYIQNHFIHLDHEQTYTASAGASYLWHDDTRFSIDSIYGSGLRTDGAVPNGASLAPYTQVNLGVSRSFATGGKTAVEARFDVVNLLDEVIEIRSGEGVGVGAPQFGPRRGFFAGLKFNF
ncbi:MAG TPA: TonB-dependent receptor [Gammaproteobacteria bacterium]|nr:TonB-dependent receptor [Gammaproteobacteria bacterium]